jgi:SAM-dependent methyltransferase
VIDHIYRDGRHYDRLFPDAVQDLPFWIDQAKKLGDPILELACGTGRISITLAQGGFAVTGIDNSQAMLSEARSKSAEQNIQVEWVMGDMRHFDLGRTFPLIILPGNALCHLLDLRDFEACMGCVRNHLAHDGKFVIDVFVPKMELLINRPGERSPFSEYDDPDGRGRIVVTESYVYEPDTQIKRIKTFHAFPGQDQEVEGELNMRMYFPQELDALTKYNGFAIEKKFGDYDRTPFTAQSEKQIIICSATEETRVTQTH